MSKGNSTIGATKFSLDDVRRGDITLDDVRIHTDTLEHQAQVAERHDNPQLAENFRRAAELSSLPDEEIMALYEALRPQRSTAEELRTIATQLTSKGAHRNAALFIQAADVYERRDLAKK